MREFNNIHNTFISIRFRDLERESSAEVTNKERKRCSLFMCSLSGTAFFNIKLHFLADSTPWNILNVIFLIPIVNREFFVRM